MRSVFATVKGAALIAAIIASRSVGSDLSSIFATGVASVTPSSIAMPIKGFTPLKMYPCSEYTPFSVL